MSSKRSSIVPIAVAFVAVWVGGRTCVGQEAFIDWANTSQQESSWFITDNWDLQRLPTSDDAAFIGGPAYGIGIAKIDSGSAVAFGVHLGDSYSDNKLTLNGGTLTISGTEGPFLGLRIGHGQGEGEGLRNLFIQNGGTLTTVLTHIGDESVTLDETMGGSGTYEMNAGSATLGEVMVGEQGIGEFFHEGGSVTADELYLAAFCPGEGYDTDPDYYFPSQGTYTLGQASIEDDPPTLSTETEWIALASWSRLGAIYGTPHGAYVGAEGIFIHTGGTNTISGDLYLGYYWGGDGSYELTGSFPTAAPTLTAANEYVGYGEVPDGYWEDYGLTYASGTFLHTCGSNTVGSGDPWVGTLWIGYLEDSRGWYIIRGGELQTGNLIVANDGFGALEMREKVQGDPEVPTEVTIYSTL